MWDGWYTSFLPEGGTALEREKLKLFPPWPGWIWAVGSLGLGLTALIFFILRDAGAFASVMPLPLESNNLRVLISIEQIAPVLIVSGIVMLKNKGAGWLTAILIQLMMFVLVIINSFSSLVDYTTFTFFQELVRRYFLVAVAAVSLIWLLYFLLDRKRYQTESRKQPPLEWEGWLWSLGNVVLGIWGIILYGLSVGDKYFEGLCVLTDLLWYTGLAHYVYDIFPVMMIAGAVMLKFRKAGYLAALTSLIVIGVLFSVSIFVEVRLIFFGGIERVVTVEGISLLVQYGLTLTWLIYFIKARRRYGIGNKRED